MASASASGTKIISSVEVVQSAAQVQTNDRKQSTIFRAGNKAKRHRPYGLLKQLPVPLQPWDYKNLSMAEKTRVFVSCVIE